MKGEARCFSFLACFSGKKKRQESNQAVNLPNNDPTGRTVDERQPRSSTLEPSRSKNKNKKRRSKRLAGRDSPLRYLEVTHSELRLAGGTSDESDSSGRKSQRRGWFGGESEGVIEQQEILDKIQKEISVKVM